MSASGRTKSENMNTPKQTIKMRICSKSHFKKIGIVFIGLSLVSLYGWVGTITKECIIELYPLGQIRLCDHIDSEPTLTYSTPIISIVAMLIGALLIILSKKKAEEE